MINVSKHLAQFKSLSWQRKAVIGGILLVLFSLSLFVSQRLLWQKPSISPVQKTSFPRTFPPPKPTARFRLIPPTADLKVGEPQKVEIVLDKLAADALDIVLTFDPKELKVSQLTQGEGYPSYPVFKQEQDKIKISAAVTPNNPTPPPLPVTIASFYLTAKKTGAKTAIVDFVPQETIVAIDGESKLGVTVGGAYTVK